MFLNVLMFVLLVVAGLVGLAMIFRLPIHWYFAFLLARRDFIFTQVPEARFNLVMRFGSHRKTLLSKEGHKIDPDGRIVELSPGEEVKTLLPGGLRIIGWPGVDKLYKREMKFKKSLQDGTKDYDVIGEKDFFAKVDYPYAVPFIECEDVNNIPITGHATLLSHIDHPYKSLFATANFYETMLGLVLPAVRECFRAYSFTQLKQQKNQDLDMMLWQYLSDPQKNPQPGSNLSVIDELYSKYGVKVLAFRVVLLDLPPELREASQRKWQAEMDRDAAKVKAEASAALFDDTNQALKLWLAEQKTAGNKPTRAQIEAKQEELRQRALAKTPGYQQVHIKGLENATTAVVGGGGTGGTGILVGGSSGKNPGSSQQPGQGNAGNRGKSPEEEAEEFFKKHGVYPRWGPKGRGLQKS
jgi:regulator of protease activity HflC (stomatin/prohibitin superfamily)